MNQPAEKFPDRQSYLGCSEVAAAIGLSPWKSPLDVYFEKTGHIPPPDLSDNQAVHFGHVLEDVVAQEFARRTGLRVRNDRREFTHPALPFVRGHIDRRIVGQRAGLECKTASIRMAGEFGEPGTDQVPPYYLVQCAAYMAVTGLDEWHLAVLIAGNDFRTYRIPRDDELLAVIETRARAFWQQVEAREPPEARTPEEVRKLFAKDDGTEVTASDTVLGVCEQLAKVKAQLKALEQQETELAACVQRFMGPAARLLGPDGKPVATWTTQTARRFDAAAFKADNPELYEQYRKESASRVFRIK